MPARTQNGTQMRLAKKPWANDIGHEVTVEDLKQLPKTRGIMPASPITEALIEEVLDGR